MHRARARPLAYSDPAFFETATRARYRDAVAGHDTSWFRPTGNDFETLLQRSDVAMYIAKERKTGVEVYSTETDRHSTIRLGMLAELRDDNKQLVAGLREAHAVCDEHDDVASASLLENWIDEAERRAWFLFESTRLRKE